VERSRVIHYLRIAVTALSLTACALLIALWVRSYWVWDLFDNGLRPSLGGVSSLMGRVGVSFATDRRRRTGLTDYQWVHAPVDDAQRQNARTRNRWLPSIERNRFRIGVGVPYWMLVGLCVAVASVPWLPHHFSFRTLLIATTLVAVGFGIIVVLI
jgi:hypothetical protein